MTFASITLKDAFFFSTKQDLSYLDIKKGTILRLPFKELGNYYITPDGKFRSYWLHSIGMNSFNIPDRAYHLAAVIKNEFPNIQWDFFSQLFEFEKVVRDKILRPKYMKRLRLSPGTTLEHERQLIIHETEYLKYLQLDGNCDESLEICLHEEIQYWEEDNYI